MLTIMAIPKNVCNILKRNTLSKRIKFPTHVQVSFKKMAICENVHKLLDPGPKKKGGRHCGRFSFPSLLILGVFCGYLI